MSKRPDFTNETQNDRQLCYTRIKANFLFLYISKLCTCYAVIKQLQTSIPPSQHDSVLQQVTHFISTVQGNVEIPISALKRVCQTDTSVELSC